MLFRIGINLGDILIEGDDILGDGVNIALSGVDRTWPALQTTSANDPKPSCATRRLCGAAFTHAVGAAIET
jgi:hypothetical protein